ncbi:TadE/TadG family type IV pilus assembly protein [Cognatishimia sp. SS12]|uniref:TadE/TadG family type IV pilus assembly protein n=1 Tax=Cognatishimia sp. SS12 TaxID=2979465 RepID=UPI00232E536B|nr:TadE/TadG family type IV pilus assembly protein [Cognatishimia sp. SS12]MDC0736854.1 TadE/TadG family type IV pilus assembly protein [Cognatishimia sp. SS12]
MKQVLLNKLRAFRREDAGNIATEFVVMVPILLLALMAGVEIGIMTIRQTMLERSLDETVRWIRLNTGASPTHEELKAMVCQYGVVPDCQENLTLELLPRNLRAWEALPEDYACIDKSTEITPMSEYSFGMDNELVIIRACAKFEPIFPGTSFAAALTQDDAGYASITKMTAFVQEPR